MKIQRTKRSQQKGFSLIELMIVSVMLVIVGGSLSGALSGLKEFTMTGNYIQKLQDQSERAMTRIMKDMKKTGVVTVGGVSFPYLFNNGVATGAYSANSHTPASHAAVPGDLDYGTTREIVFVAPADADNNGVPDTSSGTLVWSSAQLSYVVVTKNGVNYLERRTNGASPVRIADHVERILVDMNSTDSTMPLYSVRIRLYFRQKDAAGRTYKYFAESTLRLTNQ